MVLILLQGLYLWTMPDRVAQAAQGGSADWIVVDIYKITATATAQTLTPNVTKARAFLVTQKSTNKAHVEPTGATALADGSNGATLEGTTDATIFLQPDAAAAVSTLSYIRDTSASGDATLEVWEMAHP